MARGARRNRGGILQTSGIAGSYAPQQDAVIISGTDRIFTSDFTAENLRAGTKISEVIVDNGISARLKTMSRAFEKMRWLSLQFRVAAKGGSTTSGGYIAAFIPDPLDEGIRYEQLLSHRGAVSGKWWETMQVGAVLSPVDLFTSSSGGDLRLHSPGKLVIYSDGAPSGSNTPLTVDVMWRVELKAPGFETEAEVATEYELLIDAWTVASANNLVPVKNGTAADGDAKSLLGPNAIDGLVLKLPWPIVVYTSSSTEPAFYLKVADGRVGMWNDAESTNEVKWLGTTTMVLPRGTQLTVFRDAAPKLAAVSRAATTPLSSSVESQERLCGVFLELLQLLRIRSQPSDETPGSPRSLSPSQARRARSSSASIESLHF